MADRIDLEPGVRSEATADPGGAAGPPLRILEVCTTFGVGGIARHGLDLTAWMRSRGHHVTVAGGVGGWMNSQIDPEFVEVDLHQVTADRENATLPSRLIALARGATKLRRWLRRNPVDVIHTHESAPALVARVASLGLGVPIAVTYHGSELSRVRQFGTIAKLSTDMVISVSHGSAHNLETLGNVPRERLRVIGLGLQPAPVMNPERVANLRRQLLGPDGEILVVMIARLVEQKGIDIFVDVVREVAARNPGIRFAVVGAGPQEDLAVEWARQAGVEDKIQFVGRSAEPHLYLAAADIFLLTSRWEALPFTIAEAFQMGVPAIATDCGGVAELIDDSVGKVTAVGDVAALAEAVLRIAGDPALRQAMSDAALARGREDRFKHDFNNRRVEAVYRELVASKPPRR